MEMKFKSLLTIAFAAFLLIGLVGTACGPGEPDCGDGVCHEGQTRETCPEDCAVCGDGFCDPSEDSESCPEDCLDACTEAAIGLGESCMRNTECGPAGFCSGQWSDDPICYQACVPGGCPDGNLCAEGEVCMGLLEHDGSQRTFPDGQTFGICLLPETGDQGAYEQCGPDFGDCEEGMSCITIMGTEDTHDAYCAPYCGDGEPCPEASNGMDGMCALGADQDNLEYCALVGCSGDETCPDGMECVDLGGGFVCLWPL